ncbi:MAG: Rieske 2Fe-2S domain-containing protein [Hyphomicrobium sp.]
MTSQRVDLLTSPPVVGHFYLVRTVRAKYFGREANWPVIGPRHEDADHFNFPYQHYHVDFRFVRCSDEVALKRHPYVLHGIVDAPNSWSAHRMKDIEGQSSMRLRKCVRSRLSFIVPPHVRTEPLDHLRAHYAGRSCTRDKAGGLICPHRKAPLGSLEPDEAGFITCPLHGLVIHVPTGKVAER